MSIQCPIIGTIGELMLAKMVNITCHSVAVYKGTWNVPGIYLFSPSHKLTNMFSKTYLTQLYLYLYIRYLAESVHI